MRERNSDRVRAKARFKLVIAIYQLYGTSFRSKHIRIRRVKVGLTCAVSEIRLDPMKQENVGTQSYQKESKLVE